MIVFWDSRFWDSNLFPKGWITPPQKIPRITQRNECRHNGPSVWLLQWNTAWKINFLQWGPEGVYSMRRICECVKRWRSRERIDSQEKRRWSTSFAFVVRTFWGKENFISWKNRWKNETLSSNQVKPWDVWDDGREWRSSGKILKTKNPRHTKHKKTSKMRGEENAMEVLRT